MRLARGEPRRGERVADSGNRITTWFCPSCGSALYSQNAARPRVRTLYVGILDDPGVAEISAHIWTKRKQPWVELPSHHRVFSGAGDWREDYASDLSRLNL